MTEYWRKLLKPRTDDCCELLARLKEAYDEQYAEIERLRARITALEAELAITAGTLHNLQTERTREDTFRVTHDVPPSTPRE